ncbi:MAG: MmgE/PrpD family protein [Noviherbaspirillum sp.]
MKADLQQMNLTTLLANFCVDDTLSFPESAIRSAELAIADTVGCMLAGADDPAVVKVGRSIPDEKTARLSSKSSSVQHAFPVSARDAAAVNGCAAHALDFDDNVMPGIMHSSAVLVPALFALGEEIDATASDIVRAYIIGTEVNAQIGKLVNPTQYEAGWHTTSTIGTIGTAAACATLMKLNSDQVAHAMSLGFSLAGGSKIQFGSEAKPMHAGFAAENAIRAAQLAKQGLEGNTNVFQGKWSFQDLYAGGDCTDTFLPELFPNAPLAIDEFPPVAKLYPSCGSSHLGIDAILALRAKHMFELTDIAGVDVHMRKAMVDNLRYKAPVDEKQARFSMTYCAALALVHGLPRLPHFTPEALSNPGPLIERLLPLVDMHIREATPESANLPFGADCLVQLRMTSGEVLEHIAEYPKGCSENPLTSDERREKFLDCAAIRLSEAYAMSVYSKLHGFARLTAIGELTSALRKNQKEKAAI